MNATDSTQRRRCTLLSLWALEGSTGSVRDLARELYNLHDMDVSRDQIRGDLTWLREQGFVVLKQDVAQITERGADVALNRAPWPGN